MLNSSNQEAHAGNGKFNALKSSFMRLVSLYIESAKLTAAEKLTLLLSAAVLFITAFTLVTIAIAFGAVALLQLLELALSPIAAAAILAGFFLLLALLIYLLRKPLVINPTAKFMSKLIMDIGKDRIRYGPKIHPKSRNMKSSGTTKKTDSRRNESPAMTLEEIRMRQMVNSMKIKIEQQRLLAAILPGATPTETAVTTNIYRFETLMQYATLAVTTFRMAKKAVDFFKSFRK